MKFISIACGNNIKKLPMFLFGFCVFPILCFANTLPNDKYIFRNFKQLDELALIYKIDPVEYQKVFSPSNLYIERFNVITPTKAGTHLLVKAISLVSGIPTRPLVNDIDNNSEKAWFFFHNHFWKDRLIQFLNSSCKTITLIRDPRDMLVSLCYYLKIEDDPVWSNSSIREKLLMLINNSQNFESVDLREQFEQLKRLLATKKNTLLVHFELLIGEKGGGNSNEQRDEILKIAHFLNITVSPQQIKYVQDNLFGNSWTFRKGEIGAWKSHFDDEVKELCKQNFGKYIIEFGYETDNQW